MRRCGINNNIKFDIIDVNTGINDAFIKNISSSQLFTQAGSGIFSTGIYSGINYKVEIVDSSDQLQNTQMLVVVKTMMIVIRRNE